ncbi:hypothetical protein Dda_5753 [Drechslerella dactyloides]|uniref:TcmA/NAT10 helicase domain-containing protein n=1 Tax=Drechslerella dactyloides TaxID=74499 RepID=A0AAD6IUD2_DREDA|nr:hypothetical protein Dda_5753 [Drechslerella dactyloides]
MSETDEGLTGSNSTNPAEEQNSFENSEEATLLQDIATNALESETRILIPQSHNFLKVDFGDAVFEIPELRGYGKVLRTGCLAYILEKKGPANPNGTNPSIRLVFHHYTLKKHSLNFNDAILSLSYNPKKLEVVYPPATKKSVFKILFEAALNHERVELHLQNTKRIRLSQIDKFLSALPQNPQFSLDEKGLHNPVYHIIAKSDYYGLHEDNFLKEITTTTREAEQAFGGTLEDVSMDPEDDNDGTGKLVILHHSEEQKTAMQYRRVDELQRFELWFPDETRLEAIWPRDILANGERFAEKIFRLEIPGLDEAHRQIIRTWKPDDGSWFRGAISGLNSPNKQMLASIIFSHSDPIIATEAEEGVHAVIAASSLSENQKRAAIHVLSTPPSLLTKIAAFTGAAGTGKTYTLAFSIKAALHSVEYTRILVTAKQNNAVERVFETVMNILDDEEKKQVLYLQGQIAASKTDKVGSELSDLIKRHRLEYHLSKRAKPEDSYRSEFEGIIRGFRVIFATVDIVRRNLSDTIFAADLCILDEAGATSELDSLIPPVKFRNSIKRLTDNYRMDPDLSRPLSSIFYNADAMAKFGMMKKEAENRELLFDTELSKAIPGAAETLHCLKAFNSQIVSKATWVNVKGCESAKGYFYSNSEEIDVVNRLIEHILDSEALKAQSIGDSDDEDSKGPDSKRTSKKEEGKSKSGNAGVKYRGLAQLIKCHQWNRCEPAEIFVDPTATETTEQRAVGAETTTSSAAEI